MQKSGAASVRPALVGAIAKSNARNYRRIIGLLGAEAQTSNQILVAGRLQRTLRF